MRRSSLVLAAVLALSGCGAFGLGSRGGSDSGADTFERNILGAYAASSDDGFYWRIERGVLVGKGRAIQSVLVRGGVEMADGWVEAESSRADDGGLVLRYVHPQEYYLLAFRDDAAPAPRGALNLAVYHRTGGEYRELWQRDVAWPRGTARTVRFEAQGGVLRVYLDGEPQGEIRPRPVINDPHPYLGPGRVGVRHYGADDTWRVEIDNFRWRRFR
ncbi:MAG TPA: hypothetical protein VEW03_15745 [Longimicrobiaceae bacterium]|nr:hypothetical protein [Longimicrobiaceae bacterium]